MTPTAVRLVIDHVAPAQYFRTCRVETVEIVQGECLDTGNDVVTTTRWWSRTLSRAACRLPEQGVTGRPCLVGFPLTTFSYGQPMTDVSARMAGAASAWPPGDTSFAHRPEGPKIHMSNAVRTRSMTRWMRSVAIPVLILTTLVGAPTPGVAAPSEGHRASAIVLPGATSAEGIAKGRGSTFYAGDLFAGDIFRGDVQRGTAEMFIDAPDGRQAVGMVFDRRHDLLFVAGGFTGQAYVYDTSGATVESYQFGDPPNSVINDVTLTGNGAWFTDSVKPVLYFVPINNKGEPGTFREVPLSGPAAELTGDFNVNGIAAVNGGRTLIVSHSANDALYTVDPETGASKLIAGVSVPSVDGIVVSGRRLWAVQNSNQITRILLNDDLTAGTVEKVITSDLFQTPSTAARFGNRLAVVNAKFDTGFPPTADQYEVVLVNG
jgi:sugar lactone lactonase YvrE